MSEERRHWHYGTPMSQWIREVANELPHEAVGVWQIVPDGRRGFDLESDALTDYVRRQLTELVSRGAIPVRGGGGTDHYWIVQRQYGSRPEEIVENVMREWLARGATEEDPGWLWFALPENAWTPPG
jgi:hypothetical protein